MQDIFFFFDLFIFFGVYLKELYINFLNIRKVKHSLVYDWLDFIFLFGLAA